jgi:hypothetical protein
MSNQGLHRWLRKTRKKLEKMRNYTSKLFGKYMENRLYGDLLVWAEETHYDISRAGLLFRELVNNYNELVQQLENIEGNIK